MRVADYTWHFLAERGITHVFMITGGNAMHLNDALMNEPRMECICNHHEQASAISAEGFARVAGQPAAVCTTSGPGAINAISGLYGAFADSLPVFCISGQSKRELLRSYHNPESIHGLRQLGVQEADAVAVAKPVTKYAATVMQSSFIRYELEKAWHFMTSGRPGPVFIDIPLDVQAETVDPLQLAGFSPPQFKSRPIAPICKHICNMLAKATRPVLIAGEGIREAGAVTELQEVANILQIPVVTAWMPDIYTNEEPFYCGRLGTLGTRAGNLAVQNSDFILVVGSRLSVPQVSFNWENFAREAYVVSINVDSAELHKPIIAADEVHCVDPKYFLQNLLQILPIANRHQSQQDWLAWCKGRVHKYPEVGDTFNVATPTNALHPYLFIRDLFQLLDQDAFVACGNAASACVAFQAAPMKKGQRLTSNATAGAMGHDLPSAIGSAVARKGKRVYCIAGDGSIMMNLQELQTVVQHHWNMGIFIFNNNGYFSIRNTQKNFFGRLLGESSANGISFPNYVDIAQAFGIKAYRIDATNYADQLPEILNASGPWLCDVIINPDVLFEPRLSTRTSADGKMYSSSLEDMYPFIDREEQRFH